MGGEGSFPGTAVPPSPLAPPGVRGWNDGHYTLLGVCPVLCLSVHLCPPPSAVRMMMGTSPTTPCRAALVPRVSLWPPGMSLRPGAPPDFEDGGKQGKELSSSWGRILLPGVERDKAVTQPHPSSLSPQSCFPPSQQSPGGTWARGVQPGRAPVWVSVADIGASG